MTTAILQHLYDQLPADGELLRRFVQSKDEPAFAEILRRHGPLVLGVCRRVLGDIHAAEDAFQATFVQLARRAAGLRCDGSLAGWLHTVARRVALVARRGEERRRRREAASGKPEEKRPEDMTWRELREVLDAELARLPDDYRLPLILCYLEDRPQADAAERLGWPLPTLRGRLERGRQKLRQRLVRYGLPLAAPLILLGGEGVAAELRDATLRAVFAREPLSPSVALLAAVGPPLARWKYALAASVLLVLLGGSVAEFGGPTSQKPPVDPPAKPQAAEDKGDPLPAGAVMRLGTHRFRVGQVPYRSLANSLAIVHGGVSWMDVNSGKITDSWSPPVGQSIGLSDDGRYVLCANKFIFYSGARRVGAPEEKQEWVLGLYDLKTRKQVWEKREKLAQHEWPHLHSAVFSRDNKWIAAKGEPARFYDAADGKQRWKLPDGYGGIDPIGFADGDKEVVFYNRFNAHIHVYDCASGTQVRDLETMSAADTRAHELSPDGKHVFIGGKGAAVRVWDTKSGKELASLGGHAEWGACAVTISADGRTVVTGSGGPVRVWDWPSGNFRHTFDLDIGQPGRIRLSPDGKRLEASTWFGNAVFLYDVDTGKRRPVTEGHAAAVESISATPDGKLISVGRDKLVLTWDLKDGKVVARTSLKDFAEQRRPTATSADGKRLAFAKFQEGVVNIIDRDTGKTLQELRSTERQLDQIAMSPDGKFVAAVTAQQSRIIVWSTETGQIVLGTDLGGHQNGSTVAFSPDSGVLAASAPGLVRFWDVAAWKERPALKAYTQNGLAFSPDGRTLATASVEGVKVWEVATRQQRAYIRPMKGYPMRSLTFSPSGQYLAWTTHSTTVQLYDVKAGAELEPLGGHSGVLTGLVFLGDRLATASEDSTILIWDLAAVAKRVK